MARDRARAIEVWTVFVAFLRLGLTSFGGPIAHLGYFRNEFVTRRRWLSERSFTELVALCQFLPGPTSSQAGIAIGLSRGGFPGAFAAWVGFTLPSAIALVLCAQSLRSGSKTVPASVLHGLMLAAVAVVAHAVWGMARNLCTDLARICIAVLAASFLLLWPTAWGQVIVIAAAGIAGAVMLQPAQSLPADPLPISLGRRVGLAALGIFFGLLLGLPIAAAASSSQALALVNAFYRAGSLVFGGGHVVLPLLQTAVVPNGWVSEGVFLTGYGLAQAAPGPLFTVAAFLGASMSFAPTGGLGASICLISIFAPSFLLVVGVLPFWGKVRDRTRMRAAIEGINAAVVGLLLAALCRPVWTSAIFTLADFAAASAAFAMLTLRAMPVWLVVLTCAAAGWILGFIAP